MSEQPWMPLFCDAFLADTLHLSSDEIGAYCLLLMAMWRHGGTIPDDDKDLARITRTGKRWHRIKARLSPMLTFAQGKVTQKRLQKEWDYSKQLRAKQSENAKARWNKNKEMGDATALPSHMPNECPHTHTHIDSSKDESNTSTPLSILQTVLDDDHAQAVVEHRKGFKPKFTVRAAKLLAANLSRCPDPNKAADTMIVRGWKSVEPEWLKGTTTSPPPIQKNRTELAYERVAAKIEAMENGTDFAEKGSGRGQLLIGQRGLSDSEPGGAVRATHDPFPGQALRPDTTDVAS